MVWCFSGYIKYVEAYITSTAAKLREKNNHLHVSTNGQFNKLISAGFSGVSRGVKQWVVLLRNEFGFINRGAFLKELFSNKTKIKLKTSFGWLFRSF